MRVGEEVERPSDGKARRHCGCGCCGCGEVEVEVVVLSPVARDESCCFKDR